MCGHDEHHSGVRRVMRVTTPQHPTRLSITRVYIKPHSSRRHRYTRHGQPVHGVMLRFFDVCHSADACLQVSRYHGTRPTWPIRSPRVVVRVRDLAPHSASSRYVSGRVSRLHVEVRLFLCVQCRGTRCVSVVSNVDPCDIRHRGWIRLFDLTNYHSTSVICFCFSHWSVCS